MESMAARDGATSARCRRNRQLRAFHRHEVLSVKMALATALHHSAQPAGPVVGGPEEEVEYETHNAPRGQNTPPPGTRPGVLKEPGAQEATVTVGYVAAAGAPLLAQPVLGGGDALDAVAVQFLMAQSLIALKKEEREEREERKEREEKEEKAKEKEKKKEKARKMPRRFAGRVFLLPDAQGQCGFIESGEAKLALALGDRDLPLFAAYPGLALKDYVTFAVCRGPLEVVDLEPLPSTYHVPAKG